jgi:hypothetical protein
MLVSVHHTVRVVTIKPENRLVAGVREDRVFLDMIDIIDMISRCAGA